MRRISTSGLRFALLVYVYVHSRRQSHAFLELLASPSFYPFKRVGKGRGNYSLAGLRASSPYGVWAEPIGVQPTKKQP